jgi:hypothetical protein
VLVFCASVANAQTPKPSADQIIIDAQDERLADVDAVRAALKDAGGEAKTAIVAAFLQREKQRDAEAGAASLQAVLAGRAKWAERNQQQAGKAAAAASEAKGSSTEAAR